jgi:hypothetical protein
MSRWEPHLLEGLLALRVERLVHGGHALGGDDAGDGTRDALHALLERVLVTAANKKCILSFEKLYRPASTASGTCSRSCGLPQQHALSSVVAWISWCWCSPLAE